MLKHYARFVIIALFGLACMGQSRAETDYQNFLKAAYCVAVIDITTKNAEQELPVLNLYDFSPRGQEALKLKRKRYLSYLSNNSTPEDRQQARSRATAAENGQMDHQTCWDYMTGFCNVLNRDADRFQRCVMKRQECVRTLECFEMRAPF
jgi:hypothetical protein